MALCRRCVDKSGDKVTTTQIIGQVTIVLGTAYLNAVADMKLGGETDIEESNHDAYLYACRVLRKNTRKDVVTCN
jgi:hypothetical protein